MFPRNLPFLWAALVVPPSLLAASSPCVTYLARAARASADDVTSTVVQTLESLLTDGRVTREEWQRFLLTMAASREEFHVAEGFGVITRVSVLVERGLRERTDAEEIRRQIKMALLSKLDSSRLEAPIKEQIARNVLRPTFLRVRPPLRWARTTGILSIFRYGSMKIV